MFHDLTLNYPLDIEFDSITYSVPNGKETKAILKGISGVIRHGEITAIMGPSGAGKSTFMNILAGYRNQSNGSILVNQQPRNLRQFRKLSCYIMQDDYLLPHLTVKEAMDMAAALKMGNSSTRAERRSRVCDILGSLDLNGTENTRTSALSGGQRKRLCLALELINNPPVLFLDEPTSGLDSSTCFKCIELLSKLARDGRTIICTIHQPSARLLEMFNQLIVLSEGQCMYKGRVDELVPFLSSYGFECPRFHNPADYVMEVAVGQHGERWRDLVEATNEAPRDAPTRSAFGQMKSLPNGDRPGVGIRRKDVNGCDSPPNGHANPEESTAVRILEEAEVALMSEAPVVHAKLRETAQIDYPASFLMQTRVLLYRAFLCIIRDKVLMKVRLLCHVFLGILLGVLYFGIGADAERVFNNASSFFFHIIFFLFTAMMATILTFPSEMTVLTKEHLNSWYSIKAYYLSKTIADFPFQVFFSFVYAVIVYYMTSQPTDVYRFLLFFVMACFTSVVAQTVGLVIGAVCSVSTAVFLGPAISVPLLLFSGFFINFSAMPGYLRWFSYLSYLRYCFNGMMISIYGFDREDLNCYLPYCHFKSPKKFMNSLDITGDEYPMDVWALCLLTLVLRVLGYLVLKYRIRLIQ